ncbi:MAG: hypothetical protein GX075_03970 [Firmicutes bacterium]|nr:hypothetical protein [Bacillota bacterium]
MKIQIKKVSISIGLIIGFLCIIFVSPVKTKLILFSDSGEKSVMESKTNLFKISPEEAINIIAKKYDYEKFLLEYGGIDKETGFYIINLSPGESKGAAGRTFYVNPFTGEIKDPFEELIKGIREK